MIELTKNAHSHSEYCRRRYKFGQARSDTVAQCIELQPAMLPLPMISRSRPVALFPTQLSDTVSGKVSRGWPKSLYLCYPGGRPGISSCILPLASSFFSLGYWVIWRVRQWMKTWHFDAILLAWNTLNFTIFFNYGLPNFK